MNNEEKHLREVLQAALDGKTLQMLRVAEWHDLGYNNSLIFNLELLARLGYTLFRIKPEPKVFKYQTRPYSKGIGSGVWVSTNSATELGIEHSFRGYTAFKWLAPVPTMR